MECCCLLKGRGSGSKNEPHERMFCMMNFLKNLHKEESGQDLIEYALIALLIALGAIAGMSTLASSINAEFTKVAGKLT